MNNPLPIIINYEIVLTTETEDLDSDWLIANETRIKYAAPSFVEKIGVAELVWERYFWGSLNYATDGTVLLRNADEKDAEWEAFNIEVISNPTFTATKIQPPPTALP